MKYRIYRLCILGKKVALKCDHSLDDLEKFRKECAKTYKVETNKVKFQYETDELWVD